MLTCYKNTKNYRFFLNRKEYTNLFLTLTLYKIIDRVPTFNSNKIKEWKQYVTTIKDSYYKNTFFQPDSNSSLFPKRIYFYEMILDENLDTFFIDLKTLSNKLSKDFLTKRLINTRFEDLSSYKESSLSIGKKMFFYPFEVNKNLSKYIKNIEFSLTYSFHSVKTFTICIEPNQSFIDNFVKILETNYPELTILNFSLFQKNYLYKTYGDDYILKSHLTNLYNEIYSEVKNLILKNIKGVYSVNKFIHPHLFIYEYNKNGENDNFFWKLFNLQNKSTNLFKNTTNNLELSKVNYYLFNSSSSYSLYYNQNNISYDSLINSIDSHLHLLMDKWNPFFSSTLLLDSYLKNLEKESISIRNLIFKNKYKNHRKYRQNSFIFDRIYSELLQENFNIFSDAPEFLDKNKNKSFFPIEKSILLDKFEKIDSLRKRNKELLLEYYNYNNNKKLFWIAFSSLFFGVISFFGYDRIETAISKFFNLTFLFLSKF